MPALLDRSRNETEEEKIYKVSQIAAYVPSAADHQQGLRRQLTPLITIDFGEVPADLRQAIIDVMTLVYLLSGKRQIFRIPDPLSRRRLVVDEVGLVKLSIVLQQVSEILRAILVRLGAPHQSGKMLHVYLHRSTPTLMDGRDHFGISVDHYPIKKGIPNVREAIQSAFDLSSFAPPLGEQLRDCHRSYTDRQG